MERKSQYEADGDHRQSFAEVNNGIPQGSVLGPIFFNVYIADLCRFLKSIKRAPFADDAGFISYGVSRDDLSCIMGNPLKLNIEKQQKIFFSVDKQKNNDR